MAADHGSGSVRVSVVLPVHNAERFLPDCLTALDDQGLAPGTLEVIAVDDGSTDGSGRLLDEWASGRTGVHVIHQPNSGWPGGPRNRALDLATGDYVFLHDADDRLAPGALRKLVDYAETVDADVVLPQLRIGDRSTAVTARRQSRASVALPAAFRAIRPQALFRRSLLETYAIRFPEGVVRLEDGIFVAQVYCRANRIAVLAGEDLYFKRVHPASISSRGADPAAHMRSLAVVSSLVHTLCDDEEVREQVIRGLYIRKALRRLRADRLAGYKPRRRKRWVTAVGGYAHLFVSTESQAKLPPRLRLLSYFARRGDLAAVQYVSDVRAGTARLVLNQDDDGLWLILPDGSRRNVSGVVSPDEPGINLGGRHGRRDHLRRLRRRLRDLLRR